MMDIRAINTDADYNWALREIEQYFDHEPAANTPEVERFDVLATLIEAYELKHWPIESPEPIEAIRYVMELRSLRLADLGWLTGYKFGSTSQLAQATELISGDCNLDG